MPQYKKVNYPGWLYLDGRDTTGTSDELSSKYPLLYSYLGNTNVLPDYREFALVGAEQNTTDSVIDWYSHDVFNQGQSKNDCMQGHIHGIPGEFGANANINYHPWDSYTQIAGKNSQSRVWTNYGQDVMSAPIDDGTHYPARVGYVTRGKRKAVFFYIKAN